MQKTLALVFVAMLLLTSAGCQENGAVPSAPDPSRIPNQTTTNPSSSKPNVSPIGGDDVRSAPSAAAYR